MKRVFLVWIFLLAFVATQGQETLKTSEEVNGFQSISQERVFAHLNTSLLLTGEYLYYSLYCFQANPLDISDISKIAYVELVGTDGDQVFKHKIRLEDGRGYGDFFIPTTVSSGSYKLLAYTQWMRNGDLSDFYQADITIINPYQSDQSGVRVAQSVEGDTILVDKSLESSIKAEMDVEAISDVGPLQIFIETENYTEREQVSVVLKARNEGVKVNGSYSVSVRRKDALKGAIPQRSFEFLKGISPQKNGYVGGKGQQVYLPELRGELFCGKVTAVENDYRVDNLKLAISVPGENFYFDAVMTDAAGSFCFNVNEQYGGDKMLFQVLTEQPERYTVMLDEPDPLQYSKLLFEEVDLASSLKSEILERSVHNQIENSYFQFRPDSLLFKPVEQIFDNKERKVFVLDDYTRFKTLGETIVEIIKDVSRQRVGQDDYVIKVKGFDYAASSELLPLILMDGVHVQDHNALLEYDARTIQEITVMQHKLIFGPEVYLGALMIKTKNGSGFDALSARSAYSATTIFKPQNSKNYFIQSHEEGASNSSLPDDRIQLLWNPILEVEGGTIQINFFTSDVTGEFIISVEGFADGNIPVSVQQSIFVR
ncbi:hypothetical protein FGM00_00320 [Aggregatimonas sangjinii]|uniref:TonB-dependent receptor n=1 Tax=Aggregatimonas sangjinii TaxID=2583587 RepID=A0A5B7SMK1_9FLAO|nr:hypothetical protein [Aggregatimonas sangjinii]QCW98638.1 hypothetical protein FGM00_00320 [Aggregatimonas sangjinii]